MTDREHELLAEVQDLRGRLRIAERQLEWLDPELVRLRDENAQLRAENVDLTRALGLNEPEEVAA
ncbi:hypothetical protein ACGFMM_01630 [Streptomyces sp. NPDC048604]|uniref:hypothetical protein n=1 Tax=Streptomyces sp. NPDC048604 TaxID=3365578 RepID=UPI00371FC7EF